MDRSYWQGRRVLVTGHSGFKGGWLTLWLRRLGAEVTGYSLAPPSEPSLFEVAAVAEGIASVDGDLRDGERLAATFERARPEVVFHLAAQALVRRGYAEPVETYGSNVLGTVQLLEAVRGCPDTRAVVVVTSDKCYANREWEWPYRESDRLGGHDPYSNSKACAELVTAAYRDSFLAEAGVAVATARSGNVVGGGDWGHDRLVPDVLAALAEGREPLIRSPQAVRPWQHVLEPLAGYLLLAEALGGEEGERYACAWNFGPDEGDARPVSWLAERLLALWHDGAGAGDWEHDRRARPHEATLLRLDASRARQRLGWAPRLDLATTLAWVVEWHRAWRSGGDVRRLTEEQIGRYEEA